jgi:endonuclease YncB( thermonuclease family)
MRYSLPLLIVTLLAVAAGYRFLSSSPSIDVQVRFQLCTSATRINCVVDGDTIWHSGVKIRIADIDTPEISKPRCAREGALGKRAKHRLLELMNQGPFEIVANGDRDEDKYGRKLRVVERDGKSLGMVLVSEGLAHVWDGRKHSWC